jgi:hypothetical protein
MKIELQDLAKKLPLPATEKWPEGVWDVEALKNGSMSLILFTPKGKDYQTPHDQDKLLVVTHWYPDSYKPTLIGVTLY